MGNTYNKNYCRDCKNDLSKRTYRRGHRGHDPCDMCGRLTCYKSDCSYVVKNWHCESCSYKWAKIKAKLDPTYPYR